MVRLRGIVSFIGAFLAITVACLPLIAYGPQTGDSLYLNMPWFNFFAEEVLSGTAYPRWLMGMSAGAGSPVFFFYGAVPFYFTTLSAFIFSGAHEAVQLGTGQYLIVLASAGGFYAFARQYVQRGVSALGAVLYSLAPYHFEMDLLYRQAIGEATAFIWIPLVFLAIGKLLESRTAVVLLAVVYGLLVMTHLPTALLCSPFFLLYGLVIYSINREFLQLLRFAAGIVLGLLLAACYLLPAIFMQDYVTAEYLWISYFDYQRWFFLDGIEAPHPGDEKQLFAIALANTVFFLLTWPVVYVLSRHSEKPLAITLLLVVAGGWFLMTPLSAPVWKLIPLLQKVQFPWRVMAIQEFAVVATVCLALGFAVQRGGRYTAGVIVLVTVVMAAWIGYRMILGYQEHLALAKDPANQRSLHAQAIAGNGAREYIPVAVNSRRRDFLNKMSSLDQLVFDRRNGQIEIIDWRNRHIRLAVNLRKDTPVAVKQIYFPGWELTRDQQRLDISATRRYGLIRFDAPAGGYELQLSLRPLWQERLGWALSAAGVLLSSIYLLAPGLRRSRID